MEIAVGIFWIMFGLLYLVYQAFKEYPNETTVGIIYAVIIILGAFALGTILTSVRKNSIYVEGIIYLAAAAILIIAKYLSNKKERVRIEEEPELYRRALDIAYQKAWNGELVEEEIRLWEKIAWKPYNSPYKDFYEEKQAYRRSRSQKERDEYADLIVEDYVRNSLAHKIKASLKAEKSLK